MRGPQLAVAVLLVTTGLVGCVGIGTEDATEQSVADAGETLSPDSVDVPDEATVEDVEDGLRVVLEDVQLPFSETVQIPEAATVVDVRASVGDDVSVYTALFHAETGAMRCTTQFVDGWEGTPTGEASCAGVTAVDPLPAEWTATVSSGGDDVTADLVELRLYDVPLDGIAGQVDVGNLSMPHHEVGETTTHQVASHDDTELFVEVHKPADGHEGYPTLLISAPYNTLTRVNGVQPYATMIDEFVQRGYAVAIADVRGFGQSDGCVEVWGENERLDQAALVDWITEQDFSDGHVGMWGASYVGTTPVEAAVEAPEGLDAIIPVASVINAYKDWHYGGVPNGENVGSPAAYQAIGSATTPRPSEPVQTAREVGNGLCDPTLAARANDPRAVYDEFYEVRNFTQKAGDIEAAVLLQHGFVDGTVKPSVIQNFVEEIDEPKLGLLGHWSHNYAVRADQAMLRLAWMDQFVKGQDVGLGDVSQVSVETNDGYHEAPDWPPATETQRLFPAFDDSELAETPQDGSASFVLDPTGTMDDVGPLASEDEIVLTGEVDASFGVAGQPHIGLDVTLEGAENAYVRAQLYETTGDERRLITYGASNLAHRGTHDSYEPFTPGERDKVPLPLQPTDYTLEAGDELELVLEASQTGLSPGSNPGQVVLHGGEDGTQLNLPTLPVEDYDEPPMTVDPSPAS